MQSPLEPFAATIRRIAEPDPRRTHWREAGPVAVVDVPAGGKAWIVTDEVLARAVLSDPRFAKDPALAPSEWDPATAGVEQAAAEQPSLTTLDGEPHAELRKAHAPLLSAKRIQDQSARVHQTARRLLSELDTGEPVDLMDEFSTRYPLTVQLDLLGIPLDRLDDAVAACRLMVSGDPRTVPAAIAALTALAEDGLADDRNGLAVQLRDRLPASATRADLRYQLFTLIFAGQLTTDASLGFLVARLLSEPDGERSISDLVDESVRRHPPAPFTLWRFSTRDVELAGHRLPAHSPVLIDIEGINAATDSTGPGLAFGAGPHYCIGAQLALLELRAVATVLRADFPDARLLTPFDELTQIGFGGIQGNRLQALPVALRG